MADFSKGDWEAGYNPGVTGPTTPASTPFCGGKDWPYRTVNVGTETIAIVPAQVKNPTIGFHNEPLEGSAEANSDLIASAPDMYEACLAAARYDSGICGQAIRGEVDLLANEAGITESTDLDSLYFDWQVKVKKALAKAEGKMQEEVQ